MENHHQDQPPVTNLPMSFRQDIVSYLSEGSKWARFLGILGFIMTAFSLIGVFGANWMLQYAGEVDRSFLMGMGAVFIAGIYLVSAALIFFPSLFLFRFGSRARKAIEQNDVDHMAFAFRNLKSFLKFYGVIALIGLLFYGAIFLSVITAGLLGY